MKTILVTDDDSDTNKILCRLLTMSGYRAVGACDGQQALALLPVELPDLVILDMMMPGMEGVEVLRLMRSNPATARIPVIAYSARSDAKFQEHVRRNGQTDYCVKGSMDFTQFVGTIGRYV